MPPPPLNRALAAARPCPLSSPLITGPSPCCAPPGTVRRSDPWPSRCEAPCHARPSSSRRGAIQSAPHQLEPLLRSPVSLRGGLGISLARCPSIPPAPNRGGSPRRCTKKTKDTAASGHARPACGSHRAWSDSLSLKPLVLRITPPWRPPVTNVVTAMFSRAGNDGRGACPLCHPPFTASLPRDRPSLSSTAGPLLQAGTR